MAANAECNYAQCHHAESRGAMPKFLEQHEKIG